MDTPATSPAAPRAGRREWLALAVLALPCALYSMDLTVLNLAVPELSAALRPSSTDLLWIVDIYGFLMAGSLITMGTLGDRIGRRKLLLIGAAAFGVASMLAAFMTTTATLIAARAVQGIAGATLAPSTLSLIRHLFQDGEQRSIAIGIWIASFSAGGAIGPVIGGALLAHFWWGSVFLINVPVMLLLLAVGPRLLPEFRDESAGRLDLPSAALSIAGVLSAIYGIKRFAEHGAGTLPAVAVLTSLACGVSFIRRQRRPSPLIDLGLLRSRIFRAGVVVNLLGFFTAFGTFLLIAQYLQLVLGMGPFEAGLWSTPSAAAFIGGSSLAPRLARRIEAAYLMAGGLALAAAGLVILTRGGGFHGPWLLVTGNFVLSLGLAPVFTLTTDLIVGAARPEQAGAASAVSETASELGGALGIALLGSVVSAAYRAAVTSALGPTMPADAVEAARHTLGEANAFARTLSAPLAAELLAASRAAFVQAFELACGVGAAIALAAAALTLLLLRPDASTFSGTLFPGG
jgi:DHA2 family multidrug resistance protein-like MFS transporter